MKAMKKTIVFVLVVVMMMSVMSLPASATLVEPYYSHVSGFVELYNGSTANAYIRALQAFLYHYPYTQTTIINGGGIDTHAPCQWTFKTSSHYLYGAEDTERLDTSRDNDEISAWASNGEGRYSVVTISRRDKDDYKLNNIYYNATISGPLMVEYALYRAEKLRTEKPTENQIEDAVCKAQAIMDQMNLGTWKVVFSDIETYRAGDVTEYLIHLTAVPVFEGVVAILSFSNFVR